jgi:DNA helicase-2/ATP-dependent DNA helicase PcrA
MPDYEDFNQEADSPYRVGKRVRHAKFGEGKIMRLDGSGDGARVDVLFSDNLRRTLMVKYAKLEML